MNKKEVQQRVLQFGEPLDLDKFEWCEVNKKFSTEEDNLILDFKGVDGVTFKTGDWCTFEIAEHCEFETGDKCVFKTGRYCIFDTGNDCVFKTDGYCQFDTGVGGVFDTGGYCVFNTGDKCVFNTGSDCEFSTGNDCVVVRRDVHEVIELMRGQRIRLKECTIKGYEVIEKEKSIVLDGKKYKLTEIKE